MTNNTQR